MDAKHPYADIINLPHHQSKTRPRMPRSKRAAQFAPFFPTAAYGAAVLEAARLTEEKVELTEEEMARLDRGLQFALREQRTVSVVYFQPDSRKPGGTYVQRTGQILRLDRDRRTVLLSDGTVFPIDDLRSMTFP